MDAVQRTGSRSLTTGAGEILWAVFLVLPWLALWLEIQGTLLAAHEAPRLALPLLATAILVLLLGGGLTSRGLPFAWPIAPALVALVALVGSDTPLVWRLETGGRLLAVLLVTLWALHPPRQLRSVWLALRSQSFIYLAVTQVALVVVAGLVVAETGQRRHEAEQRTREQALLQTVGSLVRALPADAGVITQTLNGAHTSLAAQGVEAVPLWIDRSSGEIRTAVPAEIATGLQTATPRQLIEIAGGAMVVWPLEMEPSWWVGIWVPRIPGDPPTSLASLVGLGLLALLLAFVIAVRTTDAMLEAGAPIPGEWSHLATTQDQQQRLNAARDTQIAEERAARQAAEEKLTGLSETLFRKNEELTRALDGLNLETRRRQELVNLVSHELRQPIHTILGLIESWLTALHQGQALAATDPILAGDLEVVIRQGQMALAFVNDLLDLVRFEATEVALTMAPMRVQTVVERALADVAPLVAPGVALGYNVPDELVIEGDARWLERILSNLLVNAAKHTERGAIAVFAASTQHGARLEVADSGAGIPLEHQQAIFLPFHSQPLTDGQRLRSTGLGLTLVQYLVERHQGRIHVTSEVGEGSCFTVLLPLKQEAPPHE
jgi:signal transduction histidine kinase